VNRRNRVGTIKLPLSLDVTMNRILEELADNGIFGKNKAEVAVGILWKWIWENEDKLGRQGVRLVTKDGSGNDKA
jgi:hypothetical protein